MLQALCDLARSEGLLGDDPDFEMKPVAWIIHLSEDGRFLSLTGTHFTPPADAGSKKKPREEIQKILVPRQPGRAGRKAPPYFLVDNAKYVLGAVTADKDFPAEEGAEKSGWFRDAVRACADKTDDVAVRAVLAFLEKVAASGLPEPLPERCKSNEQFAFRVEPDFESFVHLRKAVRRYWNQCCEKGENEEQRLQCLVTGQPMSEPGLVPLIKRLPGASTAGAAIVSFNAKAFESYGWEGNSNAPISKHVAIEASTALNRLLDPAFKHPSTGEVLPSRSQRLTSNTVVCYWANGESGNECCSALGVSCNPANAEEVGELYRSVWAGKRPAALDPTKFYAVTLSGAQGRVVVRDWFELTVGEVQVNLAQHFDDLRIEPNTRAAKEKSLPQVVPLLTLLESLAPGGKIESIPPALAAEFFHAALTGDLYPYSILPKAIERMRAEITRDAWLDSYRRDARVALIKAVLNRLRRKYPARYSIPEILATMDPTNHEPGYLLGRLLAVIERLQQGGLGDLNASVIDRYFAAASATPLSVFSRLDKAVAHYVKKMRESENEKERSAAPFLDRLRSSIVFHLRDGYPRYLPIEQQGLFLLGYHHQRHWIWLSKEKRQAWIAQRGIDPESIDTIL